MSFEALLRALAEAPPLPIEAPRTGQTIGPYVLGRALGRGGYGRVFEARDTRLERRVALKILARSGDEAQRDLLREARAIAALGHPSIVTVYDVGETRDGHAYFAMELVEGRALSDVGPLGRAATRRIAREIAEGLAHLHQRGLVHRDLKPQNVMITPSGRAKLVDFGLAARTAEEPAPAGTPAYVAPEVAAGAPADARADVHSFGVLLCWLATGRTEGAPSGALGRLATRCTARDPDARPRDGAMLLDGLSSIARARRRALIASALGLAALGALAIAWTSRGAIEREPTWTRLTDLSSSALLYEGVVSPDGDRLAYAERRGVFVQDIASGRLDRILAGELGAHCVAWSGDGAQVWIGTPRGVYVAELASEPMTPRRFGTYEGCPQPSPDGRWLALEKADSIELVDLRAPGSPEVIAPPPSQLTQVAWSPDSARLAYLRIRIAEHGAPTVELGTIELASRASRTLHSDARFLMPTRALAVGWSREDELVVAYAPSSAPSEPRQILRTPSDRWEPELVHTLPFDPCRITTDARGRVSTTGYVQDEQLLVGELGEDGALGPLRQVERSLLDERPSDWSADGRAILTVQRAPEGLRLSRQPIDDEPPEPIDVEGDASWPVRAAGGLVYWSIPSEGDEVHLQHQDEAGRTARLLTVTEARESWSSGRRPQPTNHWARCDPDAPRCLVLRASAPAELWTLAVPSGELVARRPLGEGVAPVAVFAAHWDDDPRVAIPTLDNTKIRVLRVESGEEREVSLPPGCHAQEVEWSRDGGALLVAGWCDPPEPYRVLRIAMDDRGATDVIYRSPDRWVGVPHLSPDGLRIALYGHEFQSNLWRLER